jgi:beta-lactamase class A
VTPEYSKKMKMIMSNTQIEHKFVRVLRGINPAARLFRKSGSWRTYHSDSVLVERSGRGYIAVALSNSAEGARWLEKVIVALDEIVYEPSWLRRKVRG